MPHLLLVALLLITGGAAAADPAPVGRVENVAGLVQVVHSDGAVELVAVGAPRRQGDRLRTAGEAGLGVELADSTAIAMGGNSELRIDEFVLDPAALFGIRGTQFGLVVDEHGGTVVTLMVEGDDFVGEVVMENQAGVMVLMSANQSAAIPAPDRRPLAIPEVDIRARYGSALHHLPKSATSANPY